MAVSLSPIFLLLLSTVVWAQKPTFSFEITEVNGIPIEQVPLEEDERVRKHFAVPGDILTAKMYLRDWSPEGEKLRAYQMQMDPRGFTSGFAGNIKPVDYDETTLETKENKKNSFINTREPRYVFSGAANTIPIADTITPGYRWLNVIIDDQEAVLSPQDGTKFYVGTLHLKVSEDAAGPFTIGLNEDNGASMLRDPRQMAILPLEFERLRITVDRNAAVVRVMSSTPPTGAVDARNFSRRRGGGWDRVALRFSTVPAELKPDDFAVDDGTSNPPRIRSIEVSDSTVTLILDGRLRSGSWTTITHKASSTGVRLGSMPGDVNADGRTDTSDLAVLLNQAMGSEAFSLYRTDIDGDGTAGPSDALRIIDLLTEPGAYRSRLKN